MGSNEAAWEKLFARYHIPDEVDRDGIFRISADMIREYREPRLMTKFDHRVNLPEIFDKNGLAILPVTRGDYVISRFSAYHDFEGHTGTSRKVSLPPGIQSLLPKHVVSESIALNCAGACGVLSDFLEEDSLLATVSGRMGSGDFGFNISAAGSKMPVEVRNSQIEIDGAYEGSRCLALLEAKRDLSNDFLVRQLYYPFRTWRARVTKPVVPVFFVFSNGVFYLYRYEFEDPMDYNSLRLVKQGNYVLSMGITMSDISRLVSGVRIRRDGEIPFPQADSMARVINLMEMLAERDLTRDEITGRYIFRPRQTNYYTIAGHYLGFIEQGERRSDGSTYFALSAAGRRVMGMEHRERQMAIASAVLSHEVFNETMKVRLSCGEMPDRNRIVKIMQECGVYNVGSVETYRRRASTVKSWVEWILELAEA